jgi:hypothetical protein
MADKNYERIQTFRDPQAEITRREFPPLNFLAVSTPIDHKPLADANGEAERLIALSRAGQDISQEYNAMPVNEQGAVGRLMKSRSQEEEKQVPYLNKLTVETNQDGALTALHVQGLAYDSGRQRDVNKDVYQAPSAQADDWLATRGHTISSDNDRQRLADNMATILPKLGDKHLQVSPEDLKKAYVTGKFPDGSMVQESDKEALQDVLQNFRDIATHPAGSQVMTKPDYDNAPWHLNDMSKYDLDIDGRHPRLYAPDIRRTNVPTFYRSQTIGAYELSVLQGAPDTRYVPPPPSDNSPRQPE